MNTSTHEIADGIYRLSTCVPDAAPGGFTFNQFLIDAEQPLLFHTGPRRMFPLVSAAVARILPLERLRWIAFGHVESDECGAMNEFLAAAPRAEVAHGAIGCMVSEETTGTLFCGDLFTHAGNGPAITDADIVGPALAGEELFHATSLSPVTGATIRRLAALEPRTLALMHGSSSQTRCGDSLRLLADAYDRMTRQL